MKYEYTVKRNGIKYLPGNEVPDEEIKKAIPVDEDSATEDSADDTGGEEYEAQPDEMKQDYAKPEEGQGDEKDDVFDVVGPISEQREEVNTPPTTQKRPYNRR